MVRTYAANLLFCNGGLVYIPKDLIEPKSHVIQSVMLVITSDNGQYRLIEKCCKN
jgi:hypothetical protein